MLSLPGHIQLILMFPFIRISVLIGKAGYEPSNTGSKGSGAGHRATQT